MVACKMQPTDLQDAPDEVELSPKTLQAPYLSKIDWTLRSETDRDANDPDELKL